MKSCVSVIRTEVHHNIVAMHSTHVQVTETWFFTFVYRQTSPSCQDTAVSLVAEEIMKQRRTIPWKKLAYSSSLEIQRCEQSGCEWSHELIWKLLVQLLCVKNILLLIVSSVLTLPHELMDLYSLFSEKFLNWHQMRIRRSFRTHRTICLKTHLLSVKHRNAEEQKWLLGTNNFLGTG